MSIMLRFWLMVSLALAFLACQSAGIHGVSDFDLSADPPPPVDPGCGTHRSTSNNYLPLSLGAKGSVCVPNSCDYDSCVPNLGVCNNSYAVENSQCVFNSGDYKGLQSFPSGVSTYYCTLSGGAGCDGGACGDHISSALLAKYGVTGIAAVNSGIYGLSQNRNSKTWGQGCTHNSNICYYLSGPGGAANVMITDRCAGYCTFKDVNSLWECDLSGTLYQDCGQCDDTWNQKPSQTHPSCPCIGTEGDMYPKCCGAGVPDCGPVLNECDWCGGNNHPHFDLDQTTFNHICGAHAIQGDCVLNKVLPFQCG